MALPTIVKSLAPLGGAAVVLLAPIEIDGHARRALAIAVAMILAWIVELLHPAIVGFIGAFLFRAAGDVEFETAFAGFGTTTPWFLYGALMLLTTAEESGVVARLGAISPRGLTVSVPQAAAALVGIAYALSVVLPSTLARATILALAACAWSLDRGSTRTLLLLVSGYAASAFGHADVRGGPWAMRGWDATVAIALLAGVLWLSRTFTFTREPVAARKTLPPPDLRVAGVLVVAVALWVTAPLHRASPDLVGLAAGLVCVLPGIARPTNHRSRPTADPLAIILAGTAISIPAVLLETKASDALASFWTAVTSAAGPLPQDLVAYWAATAYRMFSPVGAQPGLPVLAGIAGRPAGMAATWAYAGSTLLALHQSPALVLSLSLGGVRAWQVFALGSLVLLAGSVAVMVL